MKIRITNSSSLETSTVEKVERTEDGYRVSLVGGGATRYRRVQLTLDGLNYLSWRHQFEEVRAALQELVDRCDGEAGVRADGSNIETARAHAALSLNQERT